MVICSDRNQKQRTLLGFPACNSVRASDRLFARAVLLGKVPKTLRFVRVPHDNAEPLRSLVSLRKLPACKRPQRLIAAAIRVEADVIAHVDPAAGGHGLGRAFENFYEQEAARQGCRYLRIDTNARNTRARQLYQSLGYKEIGVVSCTFNGLSNIDLVLLEKAL